MPHIHPSSIVDPKTQLAQGVEIGPHCVIEGDVSIGEGTRLVGSVYLKGPLRIGRGNVFYPFVTAGFEPQDRKFDPATMTAGTVIGDDNVLREGVTIHAATGKTPTTLGHRNMLMSGAHMAHDVVVGDDCALANGAMLAGHVRLYDRVIFGGGAGAQQFCRVGRMAMISGNEGITRDLPPFTVCYYTRTVGSLNLIGLRRGGYRDHIGPLNEAFDILYRRGHTVPVALEKITQAVGGDPLVVEFVDFIRDSKRGITAYGGKGADAE